MQGSTFGTMICYICRRFGPGNLVSTVMAQQTWISMTIGKFHRRFLIPICMRIDLYTMYTGIHASWHYMTLHFISLHSTTLHDIALHYTTSHFVTSHYFAVHFMTSHYITLHYIALHNITWHHITLHCIWWHHIILHYLHYIMPHSTT